MSSWPNRPRVTSARTTPATPHSTYESFRDLASPASSNATPPSPRRAVASHRPQLSQSQLQSQQKQQQQQHNRQPRSPLSTVGRAARRVLSYASGHFGDASPPEAVAAPWDAPGRGRGNFTRMSREETVDADADAGASEETGQLAAWDMVCLTIGLAGAQLTWCVEMAFGTPYLLSLGLSKQATSLVWLAGPMSGLLVQPIVGALSDSTPPPYRRRLYIIFATALTLFATLLTAFATDLASIVLSLTGLGDWDPEGQASARTWGITLAVVGFWGMDFGLNGVQAGLRALILDKTPIDQYAISNAYHGRMTHIGNLLGYTLGYLPLASTPFLAWLGGDQFRRLACLSCVSLVACIGVTCWTQREEERGGMAFPGVEERGVLAVFRGIRDAVRDLPVEVRRICFVQFFAWTAFFPFLFYSTSYIAQLRPSSMTHDDAIRLGSLSLLIYSIVALATGIVLPAFTTVASDYPAVRKWPDWCRCALRKITPRNCWTFGLLWYAGCMLSTFWVRDVWGAMTVVTCCGVSWAIVCWVPFALVMESIRATSAGRPGADLLPDSPDSSPSPSPPGTPTRKSSSQHRSPQLPFRATLGRSGTLLPSRGYTLSNESTTLLSPTSRPARYRSIESLVRRDDGEFGEDDAANDSGIQRRHDRTDRHLGLVAPTRGGRDHHRLSASASGSEREGGATTLGIHNLSIVAPQFFVALVAALIFRILEAGRPASESVRLSDTGGGGVTPEVQDVVWVLRFGGLAALGGAIASRWVLETTTERNYDALLRSSKGSSASSIDEDGENY